MLKTRITEMLGIKYPIQCGTMQWLSKAELVAAVANSGGFACLAAATVPDKKKLADEIQKTKNLTQEPFGVNVSLFPSLRPQFISELIKVIIDEGVTIIETAGNNPERYRKQIVDSNLIHIHKCARLKDAVKMDKLGVDVVSIVGTESGGHPGMTGVTSMVIAPLVANQISAPLMVGGGICDGRSLVAALALGAEGGVMGTRFLCTKECNAHPDIKNKLLASNVTDTTLIMKSFNNPGRMLKNKLVTLVKEMESKKQSFDQIAPIVRGEVSRRGWIDGNVDDGLFPCGQVVGRIKYIPSVAELIDSIVMEAILVHDRLDEIIGRNAEHR